MNLPVEILGSGATVLAVVGVFLNNHRRIQCFYCWLVSNGISLACHVMLGAWALAGRDAIFWVLAIQGLRMWRKKP